MRNYLFKILVTGEGGVGKTSLLRRYVDGFFDDSSRSSEISVIIKVI
ncbi:MAG: hypothetical protein ACFFFT_00005 [Candidatus Thorarchaeota archaeon]